MRVRCIKEELSEKEIAASGFPPGTWDVTVGEEYLVLGVTLFTGGENTPLGAAYEIEADGGTVYSIPAPLFEIVDDRPSRYWRVGRTEPLGPFGLVLWPEEFFERYFFDDLSEGFPEVVRTYHKVRERLEREFEDQGEKDSE
jgi:hypothetical protein